MEYEVVAKKIKSTKFNVTAKNITEAKIKAKTFAKYAQYKMVKPEYVIDSIYELIPSKLNND